MYREITQELDRQCPVKRFMFTSPEPTYFTQDIIERIRDRDYFYRKAKRTGNTDDWNIAIHLRNQTSKNIRNEKSDFVMNKLHDAHDNSSKFWRIIKSVFPNKLQRA